MIAASTWQDAARIADGLFDWDEHQSPDDCAGGTNEHLADMQGAADLSQSRCFNANVEEVHV